MVGAPVLAPADLDHPVQAVVCKDCVRRATAPTVANASTVAAALRAVGMSDEEVIDLLHAVAIFGWANRLMQNLGEPHAEAQKEDDVAGRAG